MSFRINHERDSVPESYFLRFVQPSNYNTRSSFRGTGAPRASDASVYYRQYPLGWLFFSVQHVNGLLSLLGGEMPGIRLEDLTNEMLQVWDFTGRDTYADPDDQATLTRGLESLDAMLIERMRGVYQRLQNGQVAYNSYLIAPNRPIANAESTNTASRVTISADTNGFIQGGNIDFSSSMVVPTSFTYPTVQPLTKYA